MSASRRSGLPSPSRLRSRRPARRTLSRPHSAFHRQPHQRQDADLPWHGSEERPDRIADQRQRRNRKRRFQWQLTATVVNPPSDGTYDSPRQRQWVVQHASGNLSFTIDTVRRASRRVNCLLRYGTSNTDKTPPTTPRPSPALAGYRHPVARQQHDSAAVCPPPAESGRSRHPPCRTGRSSSRLARGTMRATCRPCRRV